MKHALSSLRGVMSGLWRDRRGATIPIVAVAFIVLVGITGFVVDASYAFSVQRSLQASTDAAALAGAQDINCCASAPNQAITTATSYSAVAGGRNIMANLTVTMASGYPVLKCLTSTGVSCSGSSGANAIVVSQQATVPTFFAGLLGLPSFSISATATAGIAGGLPKPLDVMIIVDTTQSMNTADSSCSIAGATRLTCALAGVRTMLTSLAPSVDQVGMMVFPGLSSSSQAAYDYDCNSSPAPQTAAYKAASPPMTYQVIPLSSDYRTSNASTALNPSSNLVKASQGGGCAYGLDAVGGYGTFYGDVITAAQAALVATGQASAQKVIMFLSDGDANATAANMTAAKKNNQCHEGITAAQAAAAAGTWVYSIAYGSPTAATPGSCSTDSPAISACSAMQQIASDTTKFYSDNQGGTSGCNSAQKSFSELLSLFQGISNSLLPPRLLPNNTT